MKFLIDVRSYDEFRAEHVSSAIHFPLERLESEWKVFFAQFPAWSSLQIICRTGKRSAWACPRIRDFLPSGTLLESVEHGIEGLKRSGKRPHIIGTKKIPLFRQVQIVAGFLVLIGFLLGYFLAPQWHVLSGFVGAGLLFAGVTNTCAMMRLLMLLPYNK